MSLRSSLNLWGPRLHRETVLLTCCFPVALLEAAHEAGEGRVSKVMKGANFFYYWGLPSAVPPLQWGHLLTHSGRRRTREDRERETDGWRRVGVVKARRGGEGSGSLLTPDAEGRKRPRGSSPAWGKPGGPGRGPAWEAKSRERTRMVTAPQFHPRAQKAGPSEGPSLAPPPRCLTSPTRRDPNPFCSGHISQSPPQLGGSPGFIFERTSQGSLLPTSTRTLLPPRHGAMVPKC